MEVQDEKEGLRLLKLDVSNNKHKEYDAAVDKLHHDIKMCHIVLSKLDQELSSIQNSMNVEDDESKVEKLFLQFKQVTTSSPIQAAILNIFI